MSRLDHIPDLDFEKLDINEYARQSEAEIRLDDAHKGVNIRLELGSGLSHIRGSDEELHRLVLNLLENAVIYTPEGGSVTIRTYQDKTNVALEISDTGIGIEKEEQPHIFENFYRTERARKHSSGGTGLGLSIVKRIVDLHGATIQVESQPGQGSCFRVSFPAVD
jgi:two-component system phosphate regulon sensor histidine kinase PhoR